ncbi:MAG: DUF1080 domain-containing protein [Planctomycetia bacterium]|nr:DUF1080 domain-containing protein [Planctomycetia bacterium]
MSRPRLGLGLRVLAISACALLWTCTAQVKSVRADDAADDAGFVPLLDGKTTHGWRGYKQKTAPAGWVVADGVLTRKGRGGDLMTDEKYGDFDLRLEWKVTPGANSGIMYRVQETAPASYMTGAEYQVLDNTKHHDGKNPLTSAGSLYALYAPKDAEVKPVGEWNTTRIVAKGNHIEHWLNGKKVVEVELWGDDWNKRLAASKFNAWKGFAKSPEGHIVLQDHGDQVSYRNIRIKKL